MRRNRSPSAPRHDDGIPMLTEAVPAPAPPPGAQRASLPPVAPVITDLDDVPLLTDAVEEIEAPSILEEPPDIEEPPDFGEPGVWTDTLTGTHSIVGENRLELPPPVSTSELTSARPPASSRRRSPPASPNAPRSGTQRSRPRILQRKWRPTPARRCPSNPCTSTTVETSRTRRPTSRSPASTTATSRRCRATKKPRHGSPAPAQHVGAAAARRRRRERAALGSPALARRCGGCGYAGAHAARCAAAERRLRRRRLRRRRRRAHGIADATPFESVPDAVDDARGESANAAATLERTTSGRRRAPSSVADRCRKHAEAASPASQRAARSRMSERGTLPASRSRGTA